MVGRLSERWWLGEGCRSGARSTSMGWAHKERSVGTAPLPEFHCNVKDKEKVDGPNNHQKNFGKFKKGKHNGKNRKNKAKGEGKGRKQGF
jgi:hypothetical protein